MDFKTIFAWILRIVAAFILLQTLYFKFTGSAESVELFTKLVGADLEAYMRIGTGIVELLTAALLLMPRTVFLGAFLGMGVMVGAILSHFIAIGIESGGDGGQLFLYAIIVFLCCIGLQVLYKNQAIDLYEKYLLKA